MKDQSLEGNPWGWGRQERARERKGKGDGHELLLNIYNSWFVKEPCLEDNTEWGRKGKGDES